MSRRMLWRATRARTRSGSEPGFDVEFETNSDFKMDQGVPQQLEFLRNKDLRYYASVYKKLQIAITFVKFVNA